MRTLQEQPTDQDFDTWETHLANGIEPAAAAKLVNPNLTSSAFRRMDKARHTEALAMGREARGWVVDRLVEDHVVERGDDGLPVKFKDGASDSNIQFYARRHQPAYAHQQVEIAGQLEVTNVDLAASLERLNALTDAAIRSLARTGEGAVAIDLDGRTEGGARLAVARMAGEA